MSVLDKTHSLEKTKLFPTLVHLELSGCGIAFAWTLNIFDQEVASSFVVGQLGEPQDI